MASLKTKIPHSAWIEFRKWQYWLHRRVHCGIAMQAPYPEHEIDTGYCLDSQVELRV